VRRRLRNGLIVLVVAIAGAQLVRPERSNPAALADRAMETRVQVPAEVASIFKRACDDCHSNRTRWPWYSHVAPVSWMVAHHVKEGREHLNFSDWNAPDNNESAHLVSEICKEMREHEMPLRPYLPLHPEARASEADIAAVCAWSDAESGRLAGRRR